jgi:GTPase
MSKQKKSGVVTLVGRSNVGKSTLLNSLVGFKLAAVSPKAQTTRWAMHGVLDDVRGQAVFVDTPGLFIKKPDKLTKKVNRQVEENIVNVDLLLYVVDPTRELGQEEERLLAMTRNIPNKILVINKIDKPRPKYIYDYENIGKDFKETIKVSAKQGRHLPSLVDLIFAYLPQGEAMYPAQAERDPGTAEFKLWVAEIIREKLFHFVYQEVPYSTHIVIESIEKNEKDMLIIKANILTNDEHYKPMLIGKKGAMLKQIGTAARQELELILGKKIFLDLEVETDPHWLERIS